MLQCVLPAGYNLSLVHLTIKDTRYGPGADVVREAAVQQHQQ
jgi:hypothetical protein